VPYMVLMWCRWCSTWRLSLTKLSIKTFGKQTKNNWPLSLSSVPVFYTLSFSVQFWMFFLALGAGWNNAVVLTSILFSNMERNCVAGGELVCSRYSKLSSAVSFSRLTLRVNHPKAPVPNEGYPWLSLPTFL